MAIGENSLGERSHQYLGSVYIGQMLVAPGSYKWALRGIDTPDWALHTQMYADVQTTVKGLERNILDQFR